MKLKAKDSFHTSGLGVVHAGQVFEAHDALGKEIVNKGLATVVEASTDTAAGAVDTETAMPKSAPAPLNKAEPAPLNKEDVGPADISKVRKRKPAQPAPQPAGIREGYPDDGTAEN